MDGGKVSVALRYGNKAIELAKGKTGVETTAGKLSGVLATRKNPVEARELDAQMAAASAGVREAFKP